MITLTENFRYQERLNKLKERKLEQIKEKLEKEAT